MAGREEAPPDPMVQIAIDEGRISINGYEVPDDGRTTPLEIAVDIVRSDFAEPLGRPVRALATSPDEQAQMVIHPDGRITDVEPYHPATPEGVPAATRISARLAGRDAPPAAGPRARHATLHRRRRQVVLAAGTTVVVAAGLAWSLRESTPGDRGGSDNPTRAVADTTGTDRSADVTAPAQPVIHATELEPVAVPTVAARAVPGAIHLRLTTTGQTPAVVVVTPLGSAGETRRLSLSIGGAAERVVTVDDLDATSYRWRVLVPGQRTHAGVLDVPAQPPAEVTTVPVETDDVAPPADTDTGSQTADGASSTESDVPPAAPVDPDDAPTAPVDPDGG